MNVSITEFSDGLGLSMAAHINVRDGYIEKTLEMGSNLVDVDAQGTMLAVEILDFSYIPTVELLENHVNIRSEDKVLLAEVLESLRHIV